MCILIAIGMEGTQRKKIKDWSGSGCGAVGRAVASDTRDQQFESGHRQILFTTFSI